MPQRVLGGKKGLPAVGAPAAPERSLPANARGELRGRGPQRGVAPAAATTDATKTTTTTPTTTPTPTKAWCLCRATAAQRRERPLIVADPPEGAPLAERRPEAPVKRGRL